MVVKDRIKELLFSWKVGLPHEAKINEAFLMLKREGTYLEGGEGGRRGGMRGGMRGGEEEGGGVREGTLLCLLCLLRSHI